MQTRECESRVCVSGMKMTITYVSAELLVKKKYKSVVWYYTVGPGSRTDDPDWCSSVLHICCLKSTKHYKICARSVLIFSVIFVNTFTDLNTLAT